MAYMDYYHCDVCKGKAFYDANLQDPRYRAVYDRDTAKVWEPIAIKALCNLCAKTHEIVIKERAQ